MRRCAINPSSPSSLRKTTELSRARLGAHGYRSDFETCERCGGRMRVRALITKPNLGTDTFSAVFEPGK